MNAILSLRLNPGLALLVVVGLLGFPVAEAAAAAKTKPDAKASSQSKVGGAGKTNEPDGAVMGEAAENELAELPAIPQSVFTRPKSPKDGCDPFFPASTRLFGEAAPAKTNAAPASVDLVLKALAGSPGNRFATINSLVFAEGEEREMTVGGNRIKVRCLEIREDAVVIEAGGVRRTLRMRN